MWPCKRCPRTFESTGALGGHCRGHEARDRRAPVVRQLRALDDVSVFCTFSLRANPLPVNLIVRLGPLDWSAIRENYWEHVERMAA